METTEVLEPTQSSEEVSQDQAQEHEQGLVASSAEQSKLLDERRTAFEKICAGLGMREGGLATKTAWSVLEALEEKASPDDLAREEQTWAVCALYVAQTRLADQDAPLEPNITLASLLKQCNLKIKEFVNKLRTFSTLMPYDQSLSDRIEKLERRLCYIKILSQKFESMGKLVFIDTPPAADSEGAVQRPAMEDDRYISLVKKVAWALFLLTKGHSLGDNTDLVDSVHLLTCCLKFVVTKTPNHLLREDFVDKEGNTILSQLCRHVNAEVTEAQVVEDRLFTPYIKELLQNPNLVHGSGRPTRKARRAEGQESVGDKNGHEEDWDGTGLLDDGCVEDNLHVLEHEYQTQYLRPVDIDERMCLDPNFLPSQPDQLPLARAESTDSSLNGSGPTILEPPTTPTKRPPNNMGMATPITMPVPRPLGPPPTPVGAAMESVAKLRESLGSDPYTEYSERLTELLLECSPEATESITQRLEKLKEVFLSKYRETRNGDSPMATIHYGLGVKLYLHVLEDILAKEVLRLNKAVYQQLVMRDEFQCALLACALEIVIMSYHLSDMQCPWILNAFNLCPYDFSKVIESFIRHEPILTREHIKHLTRVEERILDSMAWVPGAKVYKETATQPVPKWSVAAPPSMIRPASALPPHMRGPNQPATPSRLQPGEPQTPTRTPSRARTQAANQAALLSTPPSSAPPKQQQTPSQTPAGNKGLLLFFRKVYNLAHSRLENLCQSLSITTSLKQRIWTLFEHVITNEIHLMKGRHLDQLLMCCVYGMSKVSETAYSFKDIINVYRNQPQATSQIYRQVLLSTGEHDNIIKFYNDMFMPKFKDFILLYGEADTGDQPRPPLSPLPPPKKSGMPTSSPWKHKVSKNQNIYVSPRKSKPPSADANPHPTYAQSPVPVPSPYYAHPAMGLQTPRAAHLYCFGESPSKELRSINVSMHKPPGHSVHARRLNFDEPDAMGLGGNVMVGPGVPRRPPSQFQKLNNLSANAPGMTGGITFVNHGIAGPQAPQPQPLPTAAPASAQSPPPPTTPTNVKTE